MIDSIYSVWYDMILKWNIIVIDWQYIFCMIWYDIEVEYNCYWLTEYILSINNNSGRLGPSALAFLNKICRTHTYHRSQFLNDISMLFAIGREHVKSYPGPVLTLPPKRGRVKTHHQPAFLSNPHIIVNFFLMNSQICKI